MRTKVFTLIFILEEGRSVKVRCSKCGRLYSVQAEVRAIPRCGLLYLTVTDQGICPECRAMLEKEGEA